MKRTAPFLVVVLAMCLALAGCVSINSQIPAVATDPNGNVVTKADQNGFQINYYNVNNGTSVLADPNTTNTPVTPQPTAEAVATVAPETTVPAPVVESTTQPPVATGLFATDAQALSYFNTAVNKVKEQTAGFTKSKKTVGTEMVLSNALVNAIANAIKDSLLPNDTTVTTVTKGQSSNDIMSPPGKNYASALTIEDIQSITAEQTADGCVITVALPDMTNPDAQNSAYAKIFEFITVDDIMNIYAPNMNATVEREDVFFDFAGCYAKATISADGTLTAYETFVSGTMRLTNGKVRGFTTDLSILLSSTTTYSDFQW